MKDLVVIKRYYSEGTIADIKLQNELMQKIYSESKFYD